MSGRYVFYFGNGHADGSAKDKQTLGGKGANLAEMTLLGIPVPQGFTINTDVCRFYLREGRYPAELESQVRAAIYRMEQDSGKRFGGLENPLLVSVRSGSAVSMPGMMDTILNLGLNDDTVEALARAADDARFAYDSYRRFIQMYSDVVLGVSAHLFEEQLSSAKLCVHAEEDTALDVEALRTLVATYKQLVEEQTGLPFPEDPEVQLWGAIEAVFRSWNVERAISYRRVHGIPDYLGTAVNVQAMVYGNMGNDSGTGVAFTRNPSTGERRFFGEFLVNAQGEDVVAGIRTPLSIEQMAERLPSAYTELLEVQQVLEDHFRDMQDLEFTVEHGKLFLLQTRTGKRTAAAAIRIATDMVAEGRITQRDAILRVDPRQLEQLLHPRLDPAAATKLLITGLPASPGAASGVVVFEPADAIARAAEGTPVVLIREETSPDDFDGMVAAQAVVTARGGMTSHAAVVARGMGKCCVAGATGLRIDAQAGVCSHGDLRVQKGEWVTVDGTTGRVLIGRVATVDPVLGDDFHLLMSWADEYRRMGVRTNADTPADAAKARSFGAEGIGLCRTEHMFFEGDRIQAVREMILAEGSNERAAAIAKILPMQRDDFLGIFRAMDGYPVTVRLLDPPLHEFLPRGTHEIEHFARAAGVAPAAVTHLVAMHTETNPMLGRRGVRLGVSYPEIFEMQVQALFEAAVEAKQQGVDVHPEIMIPLVADVNELARQRVLVERVAEDVMQRTGVHITYLVGTMIELPRAALLANEIAREADFFSFGTNDLTQTTYGISRDDAGSFLPAYIEQGIFRDDPFQVLDREGVGQLIQMATWEGRQRTSTLKVGVCGEHGGEPQSVEFFHETGLDYVSCSPFRVPIARLAAAHAALKTQTGLTQKADARSQRAESQSFGTRGIAASTMPA